MTERKRETRKRIIEKFINDGRATAAQLVALAGVSRTTVIKEINVLLEEGMILKDGVNYRLNSDIAVVMLKIYSSCGEILGYSFAGEIIDRRSFDFSPMETYGENLMEFVKRTEMYADFLGRKYSHVLRCLAYDGAAGALCPLPDIFSTVVRREELLAYALGELWGEGLCLYVDRRGSCFFLCESGKPLNCFKPIVDEVVSYISGSVKLIAPSFVYVEEPLPDEREKIENICREGRATLLIGGDKPLSLDEREMLFRAISSLIK